jgi:hypothetical protein
VILFVGVMLFIGLTLFTNLPIFIISQIIIWISTIVLITVAIYLIIKLTKNQGESSEIKSIINKGELKDTIKVFTKPVTITIEEIQLYREKGLCLVCKGKIEGINYTCPKCNALYCIKCLEVLKSLENECWVCERSFIDSKNNNKRV